MTNERLPLPVLMLVTDCAVAGGEDALVEKVSKAVVGGVNIVQLREKGMSLEKLIPLARRLRDAISGQALLVVNGAPQTALQARADGVHLPESAEAPREWPGKLLMGRSVHSAAAGRRAQMDGADYLVFGSVYETESHVDADPSGCTAFREVVESVSVPVIAIGGVRADHVREVTTAGASGVAVIRAILAADDPRAAAEALWEALGAMRSPA